MEAAHSRHTQYKDTHDKNRENTNTLVLKVASGQK